MKHTVSNVDVFIEQDGKPVKISSYQEIEMDFSTEKVSSVEIPQAFSMNAEFEIPENVKELMGIGFTPQQAWNIHFRKSSKWKVLHDDLTNEQDMMQLLDKAISRVEELENLLKEIECYEAYSWDNDRNFINTRIKRAFS
ncbi:hypothetical protein ACQVUB_26725 [Bacillus mycoides]|uniref:hypothetical protein n=1 Tax=Bacillus mycoides TaxID=1405 RepID=UPI003D653A57